MKTSRRAAGTRTAWDVLRRGFRAPTAAQKKRDIDFMVSGGELIVVAVFLPSERRTDPHLIPRGNFYVSNEAVRWSGPRRLHMPEFYFPKVQWRARLTGDPQQASAVSIDIENVSVPSIQFQFRIPSSDVDLLVAALS